MGNGLQGTGSLRICVIVVGFFPADVTFLCYYRSVYGVIITNMEAMGAGSGLDRGVNFIFSLKIVNRYRIKFSMRKNNIFGIIIA